MSLALTRLASVLPNMHATSEVALISLVNSCVDLAVFDFLRDRVRHRRHQQLTDPAMIPETALHDASPQEQAETLAHALAGLNQREREVVVERAVLELTPEEVAARRRMTRRAVDIAYSRALAKLRAQAESER